MNIFYLDTDYLRAAQYQCDKHIVKMPLETAQLLCTAVIQCGGTAPYHSCYENHPCSRWARASKGNFNWLKRHGLALCAEYTFRYAKHHRCFSVIDNISDELIPDGPFFDPPQCVPESCKQPNTVQSYRHYYNTVKYKIAKWKLGNRPDWYNPIG